MVPARINQRAFAAVRFVMRAGIQEQQPSTHSPPAEAFARLNLLGNSPAFIESLRLVERIATVDATVLIQGETGTGKELAARALHYLSIRRDCPFVPVNCGALPDNLLERTVRYERGAFTDAKRANRGLVAQAEAERCCLTKWRR